MLLDCSLEKTLESYLDSKEIKPADPKGNQSWIIIRKTDAEAEAPILWPPEAKSWLSGKDPEAGKGWKEKEKRTEKMRWLESITDSVDMNVSKFLEIVKDREVGCVAVHGVTKNLNNKRHSRTGITTGKHPTVSGPPCFSDSVPLTVLILGEEILRYFSFFPKEN